MDDLIEKEPEREELAEVKKKVEEYDRQFENVPAYNRYDGTHMADLNFSSSDGEQDQKGKTDTQKSVQITDMRQPDGEAAEDIYPIRKDDIVNDQEF